MKTLLKVGKIIAIMQGGRIYKYTHTVLTANFQLSLAYPVAPLI